MVIRTIFRKEFLQHISSTRFLVGGMAMIAFTALTAFVGTIDYSNRVAAYHAQTQQHQLELQRARVYSYVQPVVVKKPEPMSLFARGVEGRFTNEVRIHLFEIPANKAGKYDRNPFATNLRDIDLTILVRVVLGLLALVLTFDAVIGEKENRNLALMMANDLPRSALLTGKFLGALAALSLPLAVSGWMSLAILVYGSEAQLTVELLIRVAVLFASYIIFLAFMVVLGLCLSTVSKSASRALVHAILAWSILGFIYPQMVNAFYVDVVMDLENASVMSAQVAELDQQFREQLRDAWAADPMLSQQSGHQASFLRTSQHQAVLRRFGSERYYQALEDYYRYETQLGQIYAQKIFDLRHALEEERRSAEQKVALVSRLSPGPLLQGLAEYIAATSPSDYEHFLAASRAFRKQFIEHLTRLDVVGSRPWFTDDPFPSHPWPHFLGLSPDEVSADNYDELRKLLSKPAILKQVQNESAVDSSLTVDLPQFLYELASLRLILPRMLPEFGLFLLLVILLVGLLARRFSIYPIL